MLSRASWARRAVARDGGAVLLLAIDIVALGFLGIKGTTWLAMLIAGGLVCGWLIAAWWAPALALGLLFVPIVKPDDESGIGWSVLLTLLVPVPILVVAFAVGVYGRRIVERRDGRARDPIGPVRSD